MIKNVKIPGLMVRVFWEAQRPEIIEYLKGRGFTDRGAEICSHSFIETQVFIAEQKNCT